MKPTSCLPAADFIQRARGDDLTIVYLGQVGFLLQKNEVRIVIDPYLTDSVDGLRVSEGLLGAELSAARSSGGIDGDRSGALHA